MLLLWGWPLTVDFSCLDLSRSNVVYCRTVRFQNIAWCLMHTIVLRNPMHGQSDYSSLSMSLNFLPLLRLYKQQLVGLYGFLTLSPVPRFKSYLHHDKKRGGTNFEDWWFDTCAQKHLFHTPYPRFRPLCKSSDTTRVCHKSRTITSRANHSLHSDFVHPIVSSKKNFNLYEHIIVA